MKLFIDTANIEHIREVHAWGVLAGVTTNPSLIAKEGRNFIEVIHEICELVQGPVSAEVVAQDVDGMIREGRLLAQVHEHVVVKAPLTEAGIAACGALSSEGIRVNVTLCFQASQALLAGLAGAAYISPFIGRVDDISWDGNELIREIADIYAQSPTIQTEVIPDFMGDGRPVVVVANHVNDHPEATSAPGDPALLAWSLPRPEDGDPRDAQSWSVQVLADDFATISDPGAGVGAPGIFSHGDIDQDGDSDLLLSGDGDGRVYWVEQLETADGTPEFAQHVLHPDLSQAGAVVIDDLDTDGQMDLVLSGYDDNVLLRFEVSP